MRFLNRKHCKRALLNRRKLENLDKKKHGFSQNTKVFINETLTLMYENIAFNGRKLKRSGLVHACFTIDGTVRIKKSENSKSLKVFHIKNLRELFSDFNFDVNEELFHDSSQDAETLTGISSFFDYLYCSFEKMRKNGLWWSFGIK